MKIDILSDDVIKFYSQIIDFNNPGDVLVITGDLRHDNEQNIKILK
ncbi:MAG: hypothetical protein RBR65_00090 [Aliarcobacter sp.]|jgi:regulator of RNase E activity RraA|nr:hypothetical protein [Aliarcobacter sp.]